MNIMGLKAKFKYYNNIAGLKIIEKIENYVYQHKLTYNQAIDQLLKISFSGYERKVLKACKSFNTFESNFYPLSIIHQKEEDVELTTVYTQNIEEKNSEQNNNNNDSDDIIIKKKTKQKIKKQKLSKKQNKQII